MYRVARHYSKSKQTIPILYIKVGTVNVLNISNTFLVPFSNKMLNFRAGIHKMLAGIAKREDPDQSDLGLLCLSMPF